MNIIDATEVEKRHIAAKKLPRSSRLALMDYSPGEREAVLKRWSLRERILDAREELRIEKRLAREAKKTNRKTQVTA